MKQRTSFILFFGDIIVFVGSLFIALILRFGLPPDERMISLHFHSFPAIFVLWGVVFLIAGLYDVGVNLSRKRIPLLVLKAQVVNMALAVAIFFIFPIGLAPKITLAVYLIVSTALIMLWRLFIFPRGTSRSIEKILIVGSTDEAQELLAILGSGANYKFADASLINPKDYTNTEELEAALRAHIETSGTTRLVADVHAPDTRELIPLYFRITFTYSSLSFQGLHDLYEDMFYRVPLSNLRERWLLENISLEPHYVYDFLKRAVDIVGAITLGILTFPLMLAVAIAIKLEDGGPLLYRTTRVGQYNRPIRIIKFRSMTGMDSGTQALKTVHSVTRVGATIRTLRLDELPQLWNVLRGDISFVGPRPEMPALAEVYEREIPYYTLRHLITPGLSGWAQIYHQAHPHHGTNVTETMNKLAYDMYYLRHRSFLLDLEIALKTIKTLLSRAGI